DDRLLSRPTRFTFYRTMFRLHCTRRVIGWIVGSTSALMLIDANLRMKREPGRLRMCSSHAKAKRRSLRGNWSLTRDGRGPCGPYRQTKGLTLRLFTWRMANPYFRKVSMQKPSAMFIVLPEHVDVIRRLRSLTHFECNGSTTTIRPLAHLGACV